MTQNIGEIVTIVAIALISLIFVVYLIILKKNGWIGGQSNFYRCPDQECNNIFQKPIELKDLSMAPPRVYPACPECGAKLDSFFGSSTEKEPETRKKNLIHEKKPEIKSVEKKPEVRRVETSNPYLSYEKKPEIKSVEKKPEVRRVETSNPYQKQSSMPREEAPETKPVTNRNRTDTAHDSGCKYSFGYLSTLNIKQEGIPSICLGCPRTLECLLLKR